MKNIFKEMISEFQMEPLKTPFQRVVELATLPKQVRKAWVFLGMRRSGKTWSLYQLMHDLIAKGCDKSQILYLNFEDERLSDMQKKNFQDILKAYFDLYPEYLEREDIHFFFDEIHEILGWEKFIRRLLENEKMHIYICGSSCKMLSKEIASSLRGRNFVKEIFPYSFKEYLQSQQINIPKLFGTKQKIEMVHHSQNFLKWGGFPETIGTAPETHRTLLQGYTASVIYRDIIERYQISNPHALKQLLAHCLRNTATIFSVNKMFKTMKSFGYEISKNALYEYMGYFEDAYCIFSIQKFDLSLRKAAQSMKKIYTLDQGLITAFTLASELDLAAQLETAVFSHLRRLSNEIYYYHTQEGREVDFLLCLPDQTFQLFQVCLSLKEDSTREREVSSLEKAMSELKLPKGVIITLDEEEEITVKAGKILCCPFWKFFL